MGDIAINLLRESATVGFDPLPHLFVTVTMPEVSGKCNGELLERVLHVASLPVPITECQKRVFQRSNSCLDVFHLLTGQIQK